jgi:zinc/manganese transport system substrate-binding protein
MTSKLRRIPLLVALALGARPADAAIKVVATTPDVAWIFRAIGGDAVEAESLLRGTENPHFADARPDFIVKVAKAQIVGAVGLDLEVGWLPKVLARSGNATVQPGGKGYCELGRTVSVLERPVGAVDRSMGDVHPAGNPHFTLSPEALVEAGLAARDALVAADPAQAERFKSGYAAYAKTLRELHARLKARLAAAVPAGTVVQEYHREFAYFLAAFDLKSAGSIEEKPGVPPSAARLAQAAASAKAAGAKLVVASTHDPARTLDRYRELAGVPVLVLPTLSRSDADPRDPPALLTQLIEACAKALKP